jgi:hypothetical protein
VVLDRDAPNLPGVMSRSWVRLTVCTGGAPRWALKGKISGGMVQNSGKIDVNKCSSKLNFDRGSDQHNFQATFNCRSSYLVMENGELGP